MMKTTARATVLGIVCFLSSYSLGFAAADKVRASDPITAISTNFDNHTLSADQRALLTIMALKNPSALPAEYQIAGNASGRYQTRQLTMALRDIVVNQNLLSDSVRMVVQQAMARPTSAFSYVSPGGSFRLHWDTTGANKVSSTDLDFDGIPDYVEKCAAYSDSSMNRQLALGYFPPPSDGSNGGDSKYDVYFEEMGYYGYTQPENPGPQPWSDYTSYLVLHRDFIGFPPNTDPEGNVAGAAKVTCAHELHHAIQFAYDVNESGWFMELDATYMEDIVFDQVNDNYNYLSTFFSSPQTSLMTANGAHEYASFPWGMYLAQKFDTSLMVAVWEGARYTSMVTAVNDSLMGRYGWTEDSAIADFAVWNYCTNYHNDGQHHQEASNYPLMTIGRTHTVFPTGPQTSATNPGGYAASYVQFLPGGYAGSLRLIFDGTDTRTWAAYVIKSTAANVHQFEKLTLNGNNADTIDIPGFENYVTVTLVGINITPNSSAASFNYSGQVVLPYAVTSSIVTDSQVYSGATRTLTFVGKNTAPINDVVKIVWWDDLNWVQKDSVTRTLNAGDTTTVTAGSHPPQATPLGLQSMLRVKVVSLNDLSVSMTDSATMVTVVQRGDCNFSGVINLADLSYLVAYLGGSGGAPIPILEAGNFNCLGTVDLADLSAMVAYLTGSASTPPCNPF
ncbi:MAG: MXAN_6640 family putative metalloprotease [Candidatus Zixiibacteriota bacterium]